METKKEQNEIVKLKFKFLDYLEEALERSPKTLENYDRYLKDFLTFSNIKTAKDIDVEIIDLYKKRLKNKRVRRTLHNDLGETMHEKTQNYYLIALRAFLKYLRENNITTLDPKHVELIEYTRETPQFLDGEKVEQIVDSFSKKDIKSVRDKAIFLTLLSTGARVSELCALNKKDVSDNHITLKGKKDVKRKVPLPINTKEAIQSYITIRRDSDSALFVNNGKRTSLDKSIRLTPRSIQRIVQQCALDAGVTEKVSPHTLRHVYANTLFTEGKSRAEATELLGYEEILSSNMYR